MNYISTTDAANEIRATLKKAHKINSRQVSVKSDCYSMGSSIRISVKDPAVNIADVKAIAEKYESIHRDEYTGEILGGANRYVDVSYSREALDVRSAKYVEAVSKAQAQRAQEGDNSLIPIEGTKYTLGMTQHGRLSLWSDTFLCEAYSVEGIARELAYRIQS